MFKDKKNIFLAIIGIVILAGIIMFCIKGLNYNLSYGKNASISVNMGKDVDKNEIKQSPRLHHLLRVVWRGE